MSKQVKSFFAIICVVVLFASMMSVCVLADNIEDRGIILYGDAVVVPDDIQDELIPDTVPEQPAVESVPAAVADEVSIQPPAQSPIQVSVQENTDASPAEDVLVIEYTEIPLYIEDNCIGSGYKIGSITYVPMHSFCEAMLMEDVGALWDQDEESVTLTAEGLSVSLKLSDNYMTANGRCFYLPEGAYNINGTIMVPIRELAKVFNAKIDWDHIDWSIQIDISELSILESAETYYDEESLYWLSHVIFAEAGAEPLDGKIGVGNVVMNRVNDDTDAFQDTIKGVIFQVGQFAVAETGGVYLEPNEMSVVAAMLVLEGYNTVGDSKYFLNPEISSSAFFQKYKTFVITINDHDFYA